MFNQAENVTKIDLVLSHILNRRYNLFFDDEDIIDTSIWSNEARTQYKELLYEAFVATLQGSLKHDIELKENDNVAENEFSIDNGIIFLNSEVFIFLENATYDSCFIKGLITKFKTKGKKIQSFLDQKWIRIENCGGKGGIINQVNHILSSYNNDSLENFRYLRGIVIMDSDKKHKDDSYNDENGIIPFCDENNILLHILEKREIENYLPLELIEKIENLNQNELESFKKLTFDERDFYDMEKLSTRDYNTKQNFPSLFLEEELLQEMILKNCEHQNLPNEPQLILNKINSLL
ncbi:hypothetical protein FLTE109939_09295 [Flavobacterium terrigena]|uniref:Uncharacterized protein n=1 Tax=Flavobacterium terrigena TaxID=402734 RepID=A0A1H6UIG6_9FLAO|nr:hypothetical protein SAMN05660918_1876 [Flavobacterium terrigena]